MFLLGFAMVGSVQNTTKRADNSQAYHFLELVLEVLVIYLLLGVALAVVKVVAKPLLLLQKKPPPEAYKSPGAPKLALKSYMLGSYMLASSSHPENLRGDNLRRR